MLDVDSFTALFQDAYPRLWLVAMAVTSDRAEADDVVQEAAMTALRKLSDFTAGSNFAAWMSQIVRWTALNHLKRGARAAAIVTDPATIDREVSASAATSEWGDAIAADGQLRENQTEFDDDVFQALRDIGDVARTCLLLRVVHQLAYSEIAQMLDIPEGTAMSHVHRAKESMRRQLAGHQQESHVKKIHPRGAR